MSKATAKRPRPEGPSPAPTDCNGVPVHDGGGLAHETWTFSVPHYDGPTDDKGCRHGTGVLTVKSGGVVDHQGSSEHVNLYAVSYEHGHLVSIMLVSNRTDVRNQTCDVVHLPDALSRFTPRYVSRLELAPNMFYSGLVNNNDAPHGHGLLVDRDSTMYLVEFKQGRLLKSSHCPITDAAAEEVDNDDVWDPRFDAKDVTPVPVPPPRATKKPRKKTA